MFTTTNEQYPHYDLPTIASLLRQLHAHSLTRGFPMREGLVWQEDVRNAFGQVTLSADSAKRSCVLLKISPEARSRAHEEHGIDLPAAVVVVLCGATSVGAGLLWLSTPSQYG